MGVLHDEHGRRAYPTVTGNYMRFYDRVRDTLREGKAPAVTHEQMLWDMQILEAAFESDRTGSHDPLIRQRQKQGRTARHPSGTE